MLFESFKQAYLKMWHNLCNLTHNDNADFIVINLTASGKVTIRTTTRWRWSASSTTRTAFPESFVHHGPRGHAPAMPLLIQHCGPANITIHVKSSMGSLHGYQVNSSSLCSVMMIEYLNLTANKTQLPQQITGSYACICTHNIDKKTHTPTQILPP